MPRCSGRLRAASQNLVHVNRKFVSADVSNTGLGYYFLIEQIVRSQLWIA